MSWQGIYHLAERCLLKWALEHILIYEMVGDFTNKYFNYADPTTCQTDTTEKHRSF
jgi:hypothetical protein